MQRENAGHLDGRPCVFIVVFITLFLLGRMGGFPHFGLIKLGRE